MTRLAILRSDEADGSAITPIMTGPSSRYAMGAGSRLFGIAGTAAVILVILGSALCTWQSYSSTAQPVTLTVFDVAQPAALPEPKQEAPPPPDDVRKTGQHPPAEPTRIAAPLVMVPAINTVPTAIAPLLDAPAPPAKDMPTPEAEPPPPAPQRSVGKPTWEGLVLGALNKVRRYPRDARFARQQGVPYIRFVIDREGTILFVRLERSSGVRSLDQEALSLPKRAQPLPKPPDEVMGDTIELVVPVEFFMR